MELIQDIAKTTMKESQSWLLEHNPKHLVKQVKKISRDFSFPEVPKFELPDINFDFDLNCESFEPAKEFTKKIMVESRVGRGIKVPLR